MEQALVSSVFFAMGETASDAPRKEEAILRYVRILEPKRKGPLREQGAKGKVVPIQFTGFQ